MHNKLLEIVAKKKEDLLLQQPDITLQQFHKKAKKKSESKFKKIFNTKKMVFIGEIKFASPTTPNLGKQSELLKRAVAYEKNDIDAISIITEKHFFKGDPSFVTQVKKKIHIPVLQKDFVIDGIQIYEAKAKGADALLLIARLLNQETLSLFVDLCLTLGIEPVVEINNNEDLEKATKTNTNIIAVNARDLETFTVDIDRACLLLRKVPDSFIKLGFSGVVANEEVIKYKRSGARGVLIGTSLMKTKNIKKFVSQLKRINTKVKICGIRNISVALTAITAGADFLGFNFVSASKRFIDPQNAKKIIEEIKAKKKSNVKIVGVFQDQQSTEVNKIATLLDLDFVQLHGNEDISYRKEITKPIIQKIHTDGSYTDREKSDYFLLDREVQGKGKMIDLALAKEITRYFQVFIAGGLTPENVRKVIYETIPFAVDVAGGIETNGEIDNEKVKKFIYNAKGVSL